MSNYAEEYREMVEEGTKALENYANDPTQRVEARHADTAFDVMAFILAPLYDPATGTIHGRKLA